MDWVPGISQTKSLVQAVSGDIEGARQTQRNFTDTFPIVSQAKSFHYFLKHDPMKARDIQKRFLQNAAPLINEAMNSTPGLGHIKGALHFARGDREGGKDALESATHALGSMIGKSGGFIVGGPTGAFVGGVLGGNAVDLAITGIDSAIKHRFKPHGWVEAMNKGDTDSKAADTFDFAMRFLIGGFAGRVSGANYFARSHMKGKRNLFNYKPRRIVEDVTGIEAETITNVEKTLKQGGVVEGIFLHTLEETRKEGYEFLETQASSESQEIQKVSIDSDEIKFSEPPLEGYSPQAQVIIDQLIIDLHQNGWVGEPINVVKMSNGELVAFDNRKLYCVIMAGIEAPISIRDENERIPISIKLSLDENINVWGEAIASLINKFSSSLEDNNTPIG